VHSAADVTDNVAKVGWGRPLYKLPSTLHGYHSKSSSPCRPRSFKPPRNPRQWTSCSDKATEQPEIETSIGILMASKVSFPLLKSLCFRRLHLFTCQWMHKTCSCRPNAWILLDPVTQFLGIRCQGFPNSMRH